MERYCGILLDELTNGRGEQGTGVGELRHQVVLGFAGVPEAREGRANKKDDDNSEKAGPTSATIPGDRIVLNGVHSVVGNL